MSGHTVAIGDICSVVGGGTPARSVAAYYGGSIPWVTPKDMKIWEVRDSQIRITQAGLENSATRLVPANSVLIVVRSGVLKHTVPVAISRVPVAINQDMKAFVCAEHADPDYLARVIKAQSPLILRWVRATTADNFPIDKLKQLKIHLPPIVEQRRIVEILGKADALRAKRRVAITQLDTLTKSIFLDMFGDPVTNPKKWPETRSLGEIAEVVSGVTIGRKLDGKATRQVPYMAVVNVQDRHLNLSVIKTTDATDDEIRRYLLQRDDLLLTEGGDPDKLGRGSLWRDELSECIHQNHVFRVRLESDALTPLFMKWLIGSQRGKRYFLRSAKQTTGIASINMTQLRAFPLFVPPISLQRQFEDRVNVVAVLEAAERKACERQDALFASLQARMLSGRASTMD